MLHFVNPLMLIGAAVAAAPVIIHLLNRRRFKVINWAAMEFLLASSRRNFRRIRLQEIILLVIRTLVLLLVAAALARPFLAGAARLLGGSQRYVVLIIDNSFSMGYTVGGERPHDRAIQFAARILDTLDKGDVVSLISVSDRARPLVREPSFDLDVVRSEVARLPLSQGATNLPDAFRLARDLLKESKLAQKEVHLITDNQRAAWQISGGTSAEVEGVVREISGMGEFVLVDLGHDPPENVAVTEFRPAETIIGKEKPDTTFNASIVNFGETDQGKVEVSFFVDGFRQGSTTTRVPAGGMADVSFTYMFHDAAPHSLSVQLKHDRLTPDDARFLAVDVLDAAKALLVNGSPSPDLYRSATGYLRTALHPRSTDAFERSTIYEPVAAQAGELDREKFEEYEFVVLADVPRVDAGVAADLEAYVQQGGALVIFLGDNVEDDAYNETLYQDGMGLLPARLGGIRGDPQKEDFISPAVSPDTTHPLLREFRQQRSVYLNTLQFYQYALLEVPERDDTTVVFTFQNGTAAVVEKRCGRGKVLLFAFTANGAWTDFPRRPGFLLLMQETAAYVARDRQEGKNLLVGDVLLKRTGPDALVSKITVSGPGQSFDLAAVPDGRNSRLKFESTDVPGIYELKTERGGAVAQDFFAVNVDPAESDLRRIGPEELRRTFPDFRFRYLTDTSRPSASLTSALRKSDLWKRLLIAALVLMCIESVLAQRFGR